MATNEELRELLGEIKAFRADVTETMRRFDERIAECEKALIKEKQKRKSKDEKIAADLKAHTKRSTNSPKRRSGKTNTTTGSR